MTRDRPVLPNAERDRRVEDILAARRQYEEASDRAGPAKAFSPVPQGARSAAALSVDAIEGYTLLCELHRGGQGTVYRATQESTKRNVAIKVMHANKAGDEIARLRFERETHVLGRLNHPNIVAIHDSGRTNEHAYYVMDCVDGGPLDTYVWNAHLSIKQILRLFLTVCDAVHEAHVRGVIHRDLKPGNILVDHEGRPRILDFGLAKLTDTDGDHEGAAVTETGQFLGSMPWSSPEQAEGHGHDIDVRSDVYSLGVILYQLLTDAFPYRVSGSLRDVVRNIVETDPEPPSAICRDVDDEVETILLKCLQKEPARRYQSAGEIARDLRNYLDGRPIEAKRDSSWYVFRKTIRRHRVPVCFALLVVAFALAGVVGLLVSHERQNRLRAEAQRQAAIARAVNQFFNQDLLAAVRPQEKGRDVTVREVLDEASRQIDRQFPDEPVIEAAVSQTLGHTYMELGEWTPALAHAQRALALTRRHLGSDHLDTLAAMQLVGRLYRRLGRYDDAGNILHEMVTSARATLGPEHPLTTQGMNNLAYALDELGSRQEALDVNTETLDIRMRTLGPEHPETLRSLNNQGYYLEQHGRFTEAERLYARAYRLREKVLGPDHPDTLNSMGNLANNWAALGRLEDAARLHAERFERSRTVLGERHPEVLRNIGMLGDVYRRLGRYEEAESLLLHALKNWREIVGDSHREVATTLWRLGEGYASQERFEEAEDALTRALQTFRDTLGNRHGLTCRMTLVLGQFYLDRHRYEQAEALLMEAVDGLESVYGRHHAAFEAALSALVDLYESWDGAEPARGYAAKAAEWRAQLIAERHPPVAAPAYTTQKPP